MSAKQSQFHPYRLVTAADLPINDVPPALLTQCMVPTRHFDGVTLQVDCVAPPATANVGYTLELWALNSVTGKLFIDPKQTVIVEGAGARSHQFSTWGATVFVRVAQLSGADVSLQIEQGVFMSSKA